ncbi:MAG: HK97 gp10 family phage protein [Patescibacteria group bacterium]|nr:HK97 gp10 family phage protein [Patescibacteria group bacterium]
MSDIGEAIDRMIERVTRATYIIAAEGAALVEAEAKINAPSVDGTLRRSITADDPSPIGIAAFAAEVGPTVEYGRLRELGGDIEPDGHPYLAFYWPDAPAGIRFLPDGRALVHHVHQDPEPYLKPAVEMTKAAYLALARRRWADALGVSHAR